jgi:hypothetical protein
MYVQNRIWKLSDEDVIVYVTNSRWRIFDSMVDGVLRMASQGDPYEL